MTDYHSPTVLAPFIPVADITPHERLILGLSYDEDTSRSGLVYFHSWCGPSSVVTVGKADLKVALDESKDAVSSINDHIARLLAEHDASGNLDQEDDIEIDLTGPEDFHDLMFRDIVLRSATIDEIVVTQAFTCTKMRPDGFGGAVMRITPEAIQYRSTYEMLEEMRDTPIQCGVSDTTGFETRSRLKAIAGAVGWDSSTLLLLVARWAAEEGQAERLIDYLDRKAAPEES